MHDRGHNEPRVPNGTQEGTNGSAATNGNLETKGSPQTHLPTTNGTEPNKSSHNMPVAICGIGVRLPGGIRSSSQLYDFLANKKDAKTLVPKDRFNVEAYYDPANPSAALLTPYGYFIQQDLSQFDTSMFTMSKAEVALLDPAQRLLLEVTREAFESAGEAEFRGKDIGTFVGNFTAGWEDLQDIDFMHTGSYKSMGKTDFVLPNRLAFEYDLKGPSTLAKTACSASAEALRSAIEAMRSGSCSAAIVAGANLILTPRASIEISALGVLAPDGDCKTFDAKADGFARGESVCALYIKPLHDAIHDGNPIRAVIQACDSNADGGNGSRTFGTPDAVAQEALIRRTYATAGLSLAETKIVELHGTGTPVGDPLETTAIANCFGGDERVYIGSVKPNMGHGEGGSAITSIIKSIVALESKTVLPNIKFQQPNPKIPWDRNLFVPTQPMEWPTGVRERISINSFGLGGSNVHIVLDSANSVGVGSLTQNATPANQGSSLRRKHLLLFSANSEHSIQEMAKNCNTYLQEHPDKLEAMLYTLASRRERLKIGSFSIVDDLQVGDPIIPVKGKEMRRVAFVFTGQGAQWVGMARQMLDNDATFQASIRRQDMVLQSLEHRPPWTLEELLRSDPNDKLKFSPTDISQPVCTAIQIAYVDALAAWGIKPAAVVGHSSGEVAAAYAAGALSSREAITAAYYRGYACTHNKLVGGMAAIGTGREELESFLLPGVVLACDNSNASVTVSGDLEALEKMMANIKCAHPGMFVRQLHVPMAYHSPHMRTVAELYRSLIDPHLAPRAPKIPWYSTVYGRRVTEPKVAGPQYWIDNMIHPALFRDVVSQMLQDLDDDVAHLEIGPHSALAGPLRQIYTETKRSPPYVNVAERGQDAAHIFLQSIGKLHCLGIKPSVPTSENAFTLPDLPTYPWEYRGPHWSESRVMNEYRFRKDRKHELLGYKVLESSAIEPSWRNLLKLTDVSWLADHCVESDVVFPAAAYIAMAGAAIGQLTGSRDYTVSEVNILTAMLIPDEGTKEIITTLRKRDWTNNNPSKWWEFSVSSESNGKWTKHAWGQVTSGCALQCTPPTIETYSRKVDPKRWYHAMARIGINYGPSFTRLENITASPINEAAAANVTDTSRDKNTYALHPSTIDTILQTRSIAIMHGEYRLLDSLWLPTFVEAFYVGTEVSQQNISIRTSCKDICGMATADSCGLINERIAFSLRGLRGVKMGQTAGDEIAAQKYWSIEWHPAIEFAKLDTFMRPATDATADMAFVERFTLMCELEIQLDAAAVDQYAQPHFQHFISGINRRLDDINACQKIVPDAVALKALSRDARKREMIACRQQSKGNRYEATVELLWRVCANIGDILRGQTQYLDLALQDGVLSGIYDSSNSLSDVDEFFAVLGLNKPWLRVLEIGAGTGGTTACALRALHSAEGERLYQEYTVTDISAGFVNQCRTRFSEYSNIGYAMLDISSDVIEQGFQAESFDLIIASNVLHATPCLVETLQRCRTLLKPDGHLFFQEMCSETRNVDMIMGLFTGWWEGVSDGRPTRAIVSTDTWDSKLRESGFRGIEAAVKDNAHPDFYACVNIVAQPILVPTDDIKRRVTLLKATEQLTPFGRDVRQAILTEGFKVDECTWGVDQLPIEQDVISLVDVTSESSPILADINPKDLDTLIGTLTDVSGQIILWLTPSAQVSCSNPHYGQILGLARCARAELGLDMVTLETDSLNGEVAQKVPQLLANLRRARLETPDTGSEHDIESEYVWSNGEMLVSRLHVASVEATLAESKSIPEAKHLVLTQPGMLQSMHWGGHSLPPLAKNGVQVKISHVGLNFHDVAVAMGIMDPETMAVDGYHGLGCEGSGVVTAVGRDVDHVAPGNRVVVMDVLNAVLATEIQVTAPMCVRIPDSLNDEDAAALLVPYLTVLWSLVEKARFKRGQSLLIHSAAGGVGIAAIHVARWLGADFYCTVGSAAKVDFLVQELKVPRDRIFHSRDSSFVEEVLYSTQRKGVDVVLNSLSGELLHASWECVAAGGCLLELGKRDMLGRGRLAMFPFAENRSFFGIDLAALSIADPSIIAPFLQQITSLLQDGQLFPLHPTTLFEADKIADAFRYMQKGVHTGRIVVRMPSDSSSLEIEGSDRTVNFRSDALYLLAGGLGGIGKSIISWMVSHGARRFVAISPSAGTREEHQQLIQELREQDCELTCIAGDIADPVCIRGMLDIVKGPIKGVIHLAMVLCDTALLNLDHASWTKVTAPKVSGTWNLHELLPRDLDFFIMCSSANGNVGAFGQSNYAAANAYLDAFVRYRHGLGLPASVLDIAAVGEVGHLAQTKDLAERLERNIARFTTEQEFLRCFQLVLRRSAPEYIKKPAATATTVSTELSQMVLLNEMTCPLADPRNTFPWKGDPRVSILRNNQGKVDNRAKAGSDGLRSFLLALPNEPQRLTDPATADFLTAEISKRIASFLLMESDAVDASQTLMSVGADSLVALEIRNWWKQTLGVDVSALELTDASNTMGALGKLALKRLKEKFSN